MSGRAIATIASDRANFERFVSMSEALLSPRRHAAHRSQRRLAPRCERGCHHRGEKVGYLVVTFRRTSLWHARAGVGNMATSAGGRLHGAGAAGEVCSRDGAEGVSPVARAVSTHFGERAL